MLVSAKPLCRYTRASSPKSRFYEVAGKFAKYYSGCMDSVQAFKRRDYSEKSDAVVGS